MPEDLQFIPHDNILRYEEILRICEAAARLGIRIIKMTGGEPLVRKGCVDFIKALKSLPGIERVTLTTNAVLLEPYINILAGIKLDCVNISLDSLDAATYARITGRDAFPSVWCSLRKAVESGLRVKINCVPIRGVNENDILPIARLAEEYPIDARFIELMPTTSGGHMDGITGAEVFARLLSAYPDLTPDAAVRGFGPARYYKSGKLKGGIGFINALGDCFCPGCNRVRLTSEGFLKLCLYHDGGLDLRIMIRSGANDAEIESAIAGAIYNKPERHLFGSARTGIERMSRIGG
jgi:cyclic pyranopterin phosphate synthase